MISNARRIIARRWMTVRIFANVELILLKIERRSSNLHRGGKCDWRRGGLISTWKYIDGSVADARNM